MKCLRSSRSWRSPWSTLSAVARERSASSTSKTCPVEPMPSRPRRRKRRALTWSSSPSDFSSDGRPISGLSVGGAAPAAALASWCSSGSMRSEPEPSSATAIEMVSFIIRDGSLSALIPETASGSIPHTPGVVPGPVGCPSWPGQVEAAQRQLAARPATTPLRTRARAMRAPRLDPSPQPPSPPPAVTAPAEPPLPLPLVPTVVVAVVPVVVPVVVPGVVPDGLPAAKAPRSARLAREVCCIGARY